ncbi:unnamed protein product, partial [Effrenium voratum]
ISSGSQLGLLWDPACVMQRPAPDTEPPRKKLRMATGTVWSWPKRVDEIAAGLGPCLAATDGACEITWAQLAQRSKVAAKSLQKLGFSGSPTSAYRQTLEQEVIAQAPMVVMLPHGVDTLVIILGVLRQALPLLPLSISHGNRKQLLQRYEDAMMLFEPVAAITDSEMARELRQFREVKVISARGLLVGEAEDFQDVETTTDHALAYIFTSGSTGKSKCVTLTNRMAWAECQWYPELFEKLGYRVDPRKDRWRLDHEMGWWGAAFFGEVDVALAMAMPIVIMKPTDPDWAKQQVTVSGALPSQLNNLWPGAKNAPSSLKVLFSWAERCDVELGKAWKRAGVKVADLLIATEYFLTFASCHLELAHSDGRPAHAMRSVSDGAKVFLLDEDFRPRPPSAEELTGLLGVAGPQVTPGYVERVGDGPPVIGSGPLSADMFKVIDGEWVLVPKDIMKRRPDNSFVSVGRGGGTVKVRGGVLMSTNTVEVQLEHGGDVAACCITEPVHVEGGASVVLELRAGDQWSLRNSLQQASFLRMPVLFVCKMPRNESTGKVQKSLVQELRLAESDLEASHRRQLRHAQAAQAAWYWRIARPVLLVCVVQPRTLLRLLQAVYHPKSFLFALLGIAPEGVLQFALAAWSYGALAQAKQLGAWSPLAGLPGLALAASPVSLASAVLVALVALWKCEGKSKELERLQALRDQVGSLRLCISLALVVRALPQEVTWLYSLGLWVLYTCNRR